MQEKHKNNIIEFARDYKFGRNSLDGNLSILPLLDFEIGVLNHIDKNKNLIINKSRQMHMDTLMATYVAWKILTTRRYEVLYLAPNQQLADMFLDKVVLMLNYYFSSKIYKRKLLTEKIIYPSLNPNPIECRSNFNREVEQKRGKITYKKNNSTIRSHPESLTQGRGINLNLLILSEFAYMKQQEKIINHMLPSTIINDSKTVIYSSKNDKMNYFNRLLEDAWKEMVKSNKRILLIEKNKKISQTPPERNMFFPLNLHHSKNPMC